MSMMVIGHSLLYKDKDGAADVWCLLTCLMIVVVGIEIPGIHSRIRTEYFTGWTWNEQLNWIEQSTEWKSDNKLNNNWIIITVDRQIFIAQINHKCHLKRGWNVTNQSWVGLNILVITEQTITFCYHAKGSMKLNACILLLAYMVYL
jgi:hypothetical protein